MRNLTTAAPPHGAGFASADAGKSLARPEAFRTTCSSHMPERHAWRCITGLAVISGAGWAGWAQSKLCEGAVSACQSQPQRLTGEVGRMAGDVSVPELEKERDELRRKFTAAVRKGKAIEAERDEARLTISRLEARVVSPCDARASASALGSMGKCPGATPAPSAPRRPNWRPKRGTAMFLWYTTSWKRRSRCRARSTGQE